MTDEYYANPGLYLDTDDHARLLDENRAAYAHERADAINDELRKIEAALDVVSAEERDRLRERTEELRAELDDLQWFEGEYRGA